MSDHSIKSKGAKHQQRRKYERDSGEPCLSQKSINKKQLKRLQIELVKLQEWVRRKINEPDYVPERY